MVNGQPATIKEKRRNLGHMRSLILLAALPLLALSAPASATGGFLCKTARSPEIEIAVGFGHVPGAPIVAKRLRVDGKEVPASIPQWWLNDEEMNLEMTTPDAMESLLVMRTTRKGWNYDGQVTYRGKTHWIRCKES